jgi:hypothetical protein
MPLNPTQQQVVVDWLQTRVTNRSCSTCGSNDFRINPDLMVIFPMAYAPDHGGKWDVTRAAPLVVLTCNHCANVRMFSAALIGVVLPMNEGR